MKKRIFEPKELSVVKYWFWTKSRGVYVVTQGGLKFKSDYTLPELLRIEQPIEITGDKEREMDTCIIGGII